MVSKTKGRPHRFCRKLIQRKTLKDNGNMNVEVLWLCHTEVQICAELPYFSKRVWLHYVVKIRRPTEIKDKLNVLINIYAPKNDKDITNFLNYPRTILQNENLEEEENIIIAGKINCPPNPALDKKKVVQCYRGNQLLKPLIVYETNLIWLTFEN